MPAIVIDDEMSDASVTLLVSAGIAAAVASQVRCKSGLT